MAANSTINASIVVIDRHFLYLPLYLAQFDAPEIGKRPWFGHLPARYSLEIKIPQVKSDRTDAAVFEQLMHSRLDSSEIMFAACDPSVLFEKPNKNALMIASIVASSAFWAVNHDAHKVRLVSDLSSFDKILCYEAGTTSNLIARRIAKGNTEKLEVVGTTMEIQRLDELGEGVLALSPEVLEIANLVFGPERPGKKRAEIVYELSTSKEFSNVLTTVLFTRVEVLEEHPELVRGLLTAVQQSLIAIHAGHPMVKAAAEKIYRDTFRLDDALCLARRGNVFPETIQVRRDRWQRASEFHFISRALAEDRQKADLTKSEGLKAEELYDRTANDRQLKTVVSEAIAHGFREALDTPDGLSGASFPSILRKLCAEIPFLVFAFIAGVIITYLEVPLEKIASSVSWIIALITAWYLGELIGYQRQSVLYAMHWISFLFSIWAFYDLFVPLFVKNTQFVPGIMLETWQSTTILTLASTWCIAAGFWFYSKYSNQGLSTIKKHHDR